MSTCSSRIDYSYSLSSRKNYAIAKKTKRVARQVISYFITICRLWSRWAITNMAAKVEWGAPLINNTERSINLSSEWCSSISKVAVSYTRCAMQRKSTQCANDLMCTVQVKLNTTIIIPKITPMAQIAVIMSPTWRTMTNVNDIVGQLPKSSVISNAQ